MIDHVVAAVVAIASIKTLVLMVAGVLAGLIAGAIPGFTITMAIVLTLPFTFGMSPIQGLATMIGVFVGGLSGGLMSAILTGIPGTPSSIATTFDGNPMARRGEAGLALGIGIWASFVGGIISSVILVTLAPQLSRIGLEFGPWSYFSLIVFALTIAASLAGEQLVKGLIAGAFGLFLATVGEDPINGVARFTFGFSPLEQGFAFLPVLVGLFAFSQLLNDIRDRDRARQPLAFSKVAQIRVEHRAAIRTLAHSWVNTLRSSLIGVFVGVLPAAGSSISNFLSYDQAKKASRHPEKFGTGIPDGIIASEAANNATAGGALVTMMALGIPGDIVTAVMLGALMVHNVAPSPTFIKSQPVLAYSIFLAYFVANFLMLACQALSLRLFLHVTKVPMYILASVILFYTAIGVFALNNTTYDIWTLFGFGILGYLMGEFGFPLAPMILGVILGKIAEVNLGRALSINPSWTPFLTHPWSLLFIILSVFSLLFPWYQGQRGHADWARFFVPVLCFATSAPLFMMQSWVRIALGILLCLIGAFMLSRAFLNGGALYRTRV